MKMDKDQSPFMINHSSLQIQIKKGQPGYIAKFPEYLPNPPTELKRVIVSEEEASDKPPGWKATYRGKTRP